MSDSAITPTSHVRPSGTVASKVSDTLAMSGRCIKHVFRSADTLITVIAMPVAIMLMFVYVFGGAISTNTGMSYINYIVPGIMFICLGSGIAYTAVRLNDDVTSGIFDRFHSMPIAKSSILGGHVVSSLIFNGLSTVIVVIVALLIGFRPEASVIQWLEIAGIVLMFMLALTWMAVFFGLIARSVDGATMWSYVLIFLPFLSSAFVPTDTMPAALRWFANNQPVTALVESVRSLSMGKAPGSDIWISLAWCVGILVVAWAAALWAYKRRQN